MRIVLIAVLRCQKHKLLLSLPAQRVPKAWPVILDCRDVMVTPFSAWWPLATLLAC